MSQFWPHHESYCFISGMLINNNFLHSRSGSHCILRTNIKTENVSNLDKIYRVKKTEMYQTSLRGGGDGYPPFGKRTKYFIFFSFESFPNKVMTFKLLSSRIELKQNNPFLVQSLSFKITHQWFVWHFRTFQLNYLS